MTVVLVGRSLLQAAMGDASDVVICDNGTGVRGGSEWGRVSHAVVLSASVPALPWYQCSYAGATRK